MNYFTKHNVKFPQEVFYAIYDKYEGHTWYMQCILNRLCGYNCRLHNIRPFYGGMVAESGILDAFTCDIISEKII